MRRRMTDEERIKAFQWKLTITHAKPCAGCGRSDIATGEGEFHGHHVLTQQTLRKHGFGDKLWEPANGVPLCPKCHARHHSRFRPLPLEKLPAEALEFARGLGLLWRLERDYPEADTRREKLAELTRLSEESEGGYR